MYQKLMVPVDDSLPALRALEEAAKMAKVCGAAVVVVHVVDVAEFNWGVTALGDAKALRQAVDAAGQKVLNHAVAVLAKAGVPYETCVLENAGGRIADLLIAEAKSQAVDLLVMGTHGFSGLMHLLLGSVAEGVVRQASMPVLLVRQSAE